MRVSCLSSTSLNSDFSLDDCHSLSRRFTLLRSSNGDPVNLYDLKNRFAQQRVNGVDHSISEAEEDMLLSALSRIRGNNVFGGSKGGKGTSDGGSSSPFSGTDDLVHSSNRQSALSTTTTATSSALHDSIMSSGASSLSASPSRSSKRNSNNMFGAGFRDRSYMRKQTARTTGSNRSVLSTTPSVTTSTSALIDSYSNDPPLIDLSEEPVQEVEEAEREDGPRAISPDEEISSMTTYSLQLPNRLSDSQVKRMSTSLAKVLQEMEEEAEDQVLVPRTPIIPNGLASEQPPSSVTSADVSLINFVFSGNSYESITCFHIANFEFRIPTTTRALHKQSRLRTTPL